VINRLRITRFAENKTLPLTMQRTLDYVLAFIVISLLFTVFVSSYFQFAPTTSLSFNVEDGWCGGNTKWTGIGNHCFGDYYYNFGFFTSDSPYFETPNRFPNAYPPLPTFIFKLFFLASQIFGNSIVPLIVYLMLILIPMLIVIRYRFEKSLSTKISVIYLSSIGVIFGLDRGNILLLAIPSLYLFGVKFMENSKNSFYFLLPAILIKPQYALLLLALLKIGNFKLFFKSVLASVATLILSFLLFPRDLTSNLTGWLSNLAWFQSFSQEASHYPINLSMNNFILLISKYVQSVSSDKVVDVLYNQKAVLLLSFILLFASSLLFLSRRDVLGSFEKLLICNLLVILLPTSSFGYYLAAIPVLALICIEFNVLDSPNIRNRFLLVRTLKVLFISSIMPLSLPLSWFTNFGNEGGDVSVIWYLNNFLLILLLATLLISGIFRLISFAAKKS
jgi:hypothetical protein